MGKEHSRSLTPPPQPVLLSQSFSPRSTSFPDNESSYSYSTPTTPIMTPRTEFDDELPPSYEEAQRSLQDPNYIPFHHLTISDHRPIPDQSAQQRPVLNSPEEISVAEKQLRDANREPASNPAATPAAAPEWDDAARAHSRSRSNPWDEWTRHTERWFVGLGANVEQRSVGLGRHVELLGDLFGRRAGALGEDVGRRAESFGDEIARRFSNGGPFAGGRGGCPRGLGARGQWGGSGDGRRGHAGWGYGAWGRGDMARGGLGRGGRGGRGGWGFGPGFGPGTAPERGFGRRGQHQAHQERAGVWRDNRNEAEELVRHDSESESSDTEDKKRRDPEDVFVEQVREINARAESLQAQGKRSHPDIEAEKHKALEKARKDKEKALLKTELKQRKREKGREYRSSTRDLKKEFKERKNEVHADRRSARTERKNAHQERRNGHDEQRGCSSKQSGTREVRIE